MTTVINYQNKVAMLQKISKSQFKPKALEFLRMVEQQKKSLIITDFGKPVVKLMPYTEDPDQVLNQLRGSVKAYHQPLQPVALEEWETN